MTARKVANKGRAGNTPVTKELRRAAARMAYAPSVEEPEPLNDIDRTDEELDVLRALANAAERIFEHGGPVDKKPENVLIEALRTAGDDFALFGTDAYTGDGAAGSMAFRRAELRCELALAIFEFRREFGYPEASDRVVDEGDEVVS